MAVWAGEYGIDAEHVLAISHGRRTEDTLAELVPVADRAAALARIDTLERSDLDGVLPIPGPPSSSPA